jgi:photosystem II stability/assembly factor-like uncharacterized protein
MPARADYRITAALAALWLSACGGGDGTVPHAAVSPLIAALSPMASAVASYTWRVADSTPRIWHSMSSNPDGTVIVAGEAGGLLRTSHDGGATWTSGNSTSATWISSAMSATGGRIYAVQYGGAMVVSTNFGATWSPVASAGNASWEAVATSQDGTRVAAVVQNGPVLVSSDSGASWRTAAMPDGQAAHWWRWIDSSSDGHALVAVSHNGEVFRSTDYGTSWHAVTVSFGGAAVAESWYRVKLSSDGQTIAIVANSFGGAPGSGIYVSHDGGATWSRNFSLVADYTFLAMSSDGQVIAASLSNTGSTPGRVMWSGDGGASFTQLAMPGSNTNWRAIAMSSAGDRMAAATGAFNTQSTGLLYTAQSSSSAPPPAPAPAPSCNAPDWNSTTRYMPGDTVMRNGTMYVATQASATAWNVNSPPEWTPSYWSVTTTCAAPAPAPAPGPAPAPAPSPTPAPAPSCTAPQWDSTVRYMPGDRVTRLGSLYVAAGISSSVWNVNSPPEWTPSYWSLASCP